MDEKADISILGCGWLGLPLAEELVRKGFRVNGSTTTPEKLALLQQKQVQPFLLNLQDAETAQETLADFLNARVLVLNIPPRMRSGEGKQYLDKLQLLVRQLANAPVSRVLFVSSTAVYPDLNREVTEEDTRYTLEQDPENILLQAEKLFQERADWVTTVVRFGGLIGGDRHPGRFMAGKTNLPNGDAPVNLIHLEDCVAILSRIIEQEAWGRTYNACADTHPSRKVFYTQATLALGLTPPTFSDSDTFNYKLISSQKLKDELSYIFLHPDLMKEVLEFGS